MVAFSSLTLGAFLVSATLAAPSSKPRHFIASTAPHGVAPGTAASLAADQSILYTPGSPVLTGDVNIYYIYYGNFTSAQKSILEDFGKSIGSSAWYSTTRQYYYQASEGAPKEFVNGSITLGGTTVDNYSRGLRISGFDIPDIIQEQIDTKKLPEDGNGVYFFLNSGDVSESIRPDVGDGAAFCGRYCGYHLSWKLRSGTRVFYSQVGYPTRCIKGCAPISNAHVSPNNDPALDAMITTLAHELTEAVTDPWSDSDDKRAWQDSNGAENADKCRLSNGITNVTETGARYNHEFGGHKWMIQQNWSPVSQECVSSV